MTLHPSRFPKRADGTRFHIAEKDLYWVRDAKKEPLAVCPTREIAEMVAAALERVASDGTFPGGRIVGRVEQCD